MSKRLVAGAAASEPTEVRWDPRWAAIVFPLVVAIVWQLTAGFELGPNTFSPLGIARSTWTLTIDGTLPQSVMISWSTVLQGFLIASALGVPIGMLAGYHPAFGAWIHPIINLLRPIAPFAWIPMAILWFGASSGASIMISAYAAFFPIVTNTHGGVGQVRTSLIVAARTLGAGSLTIFRRIVLPGSLPLLFVGLRLGMGLSWAAVIAAELATGKSTSAPPGIGYLMYLNFAIESDLNAIGAMMVAIGVSALAADTILRLIQTRLVYWPTER